MRVLFIHQNIPGQFRHLIHALLNRGDEVIVIGERAALMRWQARHARLIRMGYVLPTSDAIDANPPHLRELDLQIHRGQRVAVALKILRKKGLVPDLIAVHPGWGEAMFIKAEMPEVPILAYCEFFYRARGSDMGFDPEFASGEQSLRRLQVRKMPHLLALDDMDAGVSPTQWQRDQYPLASRNKIEVIHDGIDTVALLPRLDAHVELAGRTLRFGDPVVTYVARNLEPYRGFHTFMRSLPTLQRLAPQATVVLVGGDEVSYGARLPEGQTYRQRLLGELGDRIDLSRVLFVGRLPYLTYVSLLRVSAVHAYLTYPFVLSWSLLEAMALGCCVVASRTPPVQEVIDDARHGLLVDFFDPEALASRLASVLSGQVDVASLRRAARERIVARYDLRSRSVPASLALIDRLAAGASRPMPLNSADLPAPSEPPPFPLP